MSAQSRRGTTHTKDVCAFLADSNALATPPAPIRFPISGLAMSPGPVTLIQAFGGSGKSLICMDLLLAVASNQKVWGQFQAHAAPVLHLDMEQGPDETIDRYHRLARARGIDLTNDHEVRQRLAWASFPPFRLNQTGAREQLTRLCEGRAFVLLDSFAALVPGADMNDGSAAQQLYMCGEVSAATGAVILRIQHTTKASLDTDKPRDIRTAGMGSAALYNAAGWAYLISSKPGDAAKFVRQIKGRSLGAPRMADFHLRLEPVDVRETCAYLNPENPADPGGFRVAYCTVEQEEQLHASDPRADLEAHVRRVLDAVKRAGPGGVAGKEALAKLARMKATDCRAAIDTAISRGLLANVGKPARPCYRTP